MQESYWVKLKDPEKFQGIKSAVQGLPGVNTVRDLRAGAQADLLLDERDASGARSRVAAFLLVAAILQVGNTIRLAAFARRREIGIMRLVGASSLYIQLPFLMESLVAALIGVGLAAGTIAAVHVGGDLRHAEAHLEHRRVDRLGRRVQAVGWIALIGLVLTLIPTLVMTRKYLKV